MASVTLPILFLKHTNTLGKGFSSSQRNVIAGLNFSIGVVDKIAEIFTAHLKRTKAGSTTRINPMSCQVHPQIKCFHSPISASCTPYTFPWQENGVKLASVSRICPSTKTRSKNWGLSSQISHRSRQNFSTHSLSLFNCPLKTNVKFWAW